MVSNKLTGVRNKLTSRVFNSELGTDTTITPVTKGSSSDGGFTPAADSDGSTTVVKGIPHSNTANAWFKTMFGESDLGEGSTILPYDTTVSVGDKITWLSKTYYVEKIDPIPLGGGIAALML